MRRRHCDDKRFAFPGWTNSTGPIRLGQGSQDILPAHIEWDRLGPCLTQSHSISGGIVTTCRPLVVRLFRRKDPICDGKATREQASNDLGHVWQVQFFPMIAKPMIIVV